MTADEGQEKKSFKVEDRRRFSGTGEARESTPPSQPQASEPDARQPPQQERAGAHPSDSFPEVSFATFLIGLSTQVLAHLGEIANPADGTTVVDLPAARQVIDILAMLRDKTMGNLDAAEQTLLENALYDLRMRYVHRARGRE